jgi:hypothetical protein
MKKRITLIAASFLCSLQMQAQPKQTPTPKKVVNSSSRNYLDLAFTMGFPLEGFDKTSTSLPAGFTMNFLHQPNKQSPFAFGGGFTFLNAGHKTIDKTLTANITSGTTLIDQLNIPLEFRINNQILNLHGMVRLQGTGSTFIPYLDLLGGFNYLWTCTALYDESDQNYFQSNNNNDNNRIYRKTQASDICWSGGAGMGIIARLNDAVLLNIGASYMLGGKADYFDKQQIANWDIQLDASALNAGSNSGALTGDDVSINAVPKHSVTTMAFANLGVTFILDQSSSSSPNTSKVKYVNPPVNRTPAPSPSLRKPANRR